MISISKSLIFSSGIVTIRIEDKLTDCKDKSAVQCSFFLSQTDVFSDNITNNALGANNGIKLKPKFRTTTLTEIATDKLEALVAELVKKGDVPDKDILKAKVDAYINALGLFYISFFSREIVLHNRLCKAINVTDTSIVMPVLKILYESKKMHCKSQYNSDISCFDVITSDLTTESYLTFVDLDCTDLCLVQDERTTVKNCADVEDVIELNIEENHPDCKDKSEFHCMLFLSQISVFDVVEKNIILGERDGEKITPEKVAKVEAYLTAKSDFVDELVKEGNKHDTQIVKAKAEKFRPAFLDLFFTKRKFLSYWTTNFRLSSHMCKQNAETDITGGFDVAKLMFEKANEMCPETKNIFNNCIKAATTVTTELYMAYYDALISNKCKATCPTEDEVKATTIRICGSRSEEFEIKDDNNCILLQHIKCYFFLSKASAFDLESENNKLGVLYQNAPIKYFPGSPIIEKTVISPIRAKYELVAELVKFRHFHDIATVKTKAEDYRTALLDAYTTAHFETEYWANKTFLSNMLCKETDATDTSVAKPFAKSMFEAANEKCSKTKDVFTRCITAISSPTTETYVAYFNALIKGKGCEATTCPTAIAELQKCGDNGLSAVEIVGIVISLIIGVVVIAGVIIYCLKKN